MSWRDVSSIVGPLLFAVVCGCNPDGDVSPSPGTSATLTDSPTPFTPTPTATLAADHRGAIQILVRGLDDRPLAGVTVDLGGGVSRVSDQGGRILLTDLPAGHGASLAFSKEGYAPSHKTVVPMAQLVSVLRVRLQPEGTFDTFMASDGYRFGDYGSGLRFIIEAGSLVNGSGAVFSGESRVSHTHLSLHEAGLISVPGSLLGIEPNGDPKPLVAYGAVVFKVESTAGVPLFLAPGRVATLELPLRDDADLAVGATVPGWEYDEGEGAYRAGLSAVVSQSSLLSDVKTISLNIPSFVPWVVARPKGGTWISGTVVNFDTGEPLAGAEVRVAGDYPAVLSGGHVGEDGRYCLRVPSGTPVVVESALDQAQVLFSRSSAEGTGVGSCSDPSLEAIRLPLNAGCIGGAILDGDSSPLIDRTVWSDSGTQSQTDAQGEFCVLGPADRPVALHAEGFTSRSTRPSQQEECPEGGETACDARLVFQSPLGQWTYHLDSMVLANPNEGLDLDQDGSSDNALGQVFSGISTSALAQIENFLEGLVQAGTMGEDKADEWYALAEDFFGQFDDTVGAPVQFMIDQGSLMWLLEATTIGDDATLAFFKGEFNGQSFEKGQSLASLQGSVSDGELSVGPSDLSFVIPPEGMMVPTDETSTLRVFSAQSVGAIGPMGLDGGILGGYIPTSDIVAAAQAFIPESLAPEGGDVGIPIPKDEIIAAIETALNSYVDGVIEGEAVVSFAMNMDASPLKKINCEEGYWVDGLEIAPPGVGPDLDGDGVGDSDMEALLMTMSVAIEGALYEQLLAAGIPDLIARNTAEAMGDSLSSMLALDNANKKLEETLGNQTVVPIFLLSESSPVRLEAWSGVFTGSGYGKDTFKWSLPGAVTQGVLAVEADSLERSFQLETPFAGEMVVGTVQFQQSRIYANITRGGLEEGSQAFAISVAEILRLTQIVLDVLVAVEAMPDDIGAPFLANFEEALLDSAGLNLEGIGPGYALSYQFTAKAACLDSSTDEVR